jgi:hypothetical protein
MFFRKLLSIASGPIVQASALNIYSRGDGYYDQGVSDLMKMLSFKNGFYALESALHVFPSTDGSLEGGVIGLQQWNDENLWRNWYQAVTEGLLFFAEDIFGCQFAIGRDGIVSFDPESGEVALLASSLEDWAGEILSNLGISGFPIAHSWQLANGSISNGKRLLPKIPFILGGSYDEKNLFAVDAVKGMRYRGELWQQIRDLPDGAQVRLKALPLQ